MMNGLSFEKRPEARYPRLWVRGILAGCVAAVAVRGIQRSGSPKHDQTAAEGAECARRRSALQS